MNVSHQLPRKTVRWIAGVFVLAPVMFASHFFSQQQTSASTPPQSTVTLLDSTSLTGQVNHDPASRTVIVTTISKEGYRTVDYVAGALVKQVEPAVSDATGVSSAPATELRPPLVTALWLTDGMTLQGMWQPGAPAGHIGVLPTGATQPIAVPLTAIARLSLAEGATATESAAGTNHAPRTPSASHTQQAPSANQPRQTPAVGKVSLQDNTMLTGQVNYDPATHIIMVAAVNPGGRRTVDYIAAPLVKHIEAVTTETQGAQSTTTDLQPPFTATLWLTNGTTLKGTWQAGAPSGQLGLLPEGAAQPIAVPLSAVTRLSLTESGGASASADKAQPSSDEKKPPASEGQRTSTIKDSLYTAIPIGPLAATPPAIPPQGSEVVVTTNLGQQFAGALEFSDGDWLGLRVSSLANLSLSPPQLSLINRANIVSIKELTHAAVAKN